MFCALFYVVVALAVMFVCALRTGDGMVAVGMGLSWPVSLPIFGTLRAAELTRQRVEKAKRDHEENAYKAAYARFEACNHEADSYGRCALCGGYQESTLGGMKWRFR